MPQHTGWLTKKNQRRWCALQDSVLYWCHGVQVCTRFVCGWPLQNSGADLSRLASGSLNLKACILLSLSPTRPLTIQIATETKTFLCTSFLLYFSCIKREDRHWRWTFGLVHCIKSCCVQVPGWHCCMSMVSICAHQKGLPTALEIMSGSLAKKGTTRHFVLRDGTLSWYQTKEVRRTVIWTN